MSPKFSHRTAEAKEAVAVKGRGAALHGRIPGLEIETGASATSLVCEIPNSSLCFRIGNWRFGLFMDNCVMKSWTDNEGSSLSERQSRGSSWRVEQEIVPIYLSELEFPSTPNESVVYRKPSANS